MTQLIIAPLGAEWPNLSEMPAKITTWEAQAAVRLPVDYSNFLQVYGGGRPYPNVFEAAVPDENWDSFDKNLFCNPLYGFDYAVSLWTKATFGESTPAGLFFVGSDPGNLQLLLSLRKHDFGKVYLWLPTMDNWGTDGNNDSNLYLQAQSFTDFLRSLHDTADLIGRDNWHTPRNAMLARDLILV